MMFASPVASSPTYPAYNLGKISESSDNGIYLGDEPKKTTDSSYDELSGIYIGDDTAKKTSAHEGVTSRSEGGGILARWYEEAERRRKIAKRETGLYDDASGVYLGNEKSPQKSLLNQEDIVPGGIMAKLYQNKTGNSKHRRNLSEGNFSSSTSALNEVKEVESKRRTYSNVDHLQSSIEFKTGGPPISRQDSGLEMHQARSLVSNIDDDDNRDNDGDDYN